MTTRTCKVDQDGRCEGFSPITETDAGRFGELLESGQEVVCDGGDPGTIERIYSHIQTRSFGSNFVAVDITVGTD